MTNEQLKIVTFFLERLEAKIEDYKLTVEKKLDDMTKTLDGIEMKISEIENMIPNAEQLKEDMDKLNLEILSIKDEGGM